MTQIGAIFVGALTLLTLGGFGFFIHKKGDQAGHFMFLYVLFLIIVAILITLVYLMFVLIRLLP